MNQKRNEDAAKAFLSKLSESERTIMATLQEVIIWQKTDRKGKMVDAADSLHMIMGAVTASDGEGFRIGFLSHHLGEYLVNNENATFEGAYKYLLTETDRKP